MQHIQQVTQNTIKELRSTVWLINQQEFSLEEFVVKLGEYLKPYYGSKTKISIIDQSDKDYSLEPIIATNLFRILQELVNNVIQHSSANELKLSFTVSPPKQTVKIVSVNGQKDNISVDLTKDMVIELEPMKDERIPVMVSLTGNVIGIKTLYEVGWFPAGNKITIPAACFRNMNGVQNNISFGGCYLQLSRIGKEKATDVSGVYSEVEYANSVSDGRFITVSAKPVFNKGLEVKGTETGVNYAYS